MYPLKTPHTVASLPLLVCALLLASLTGCAFAEAATEQILGPPDSAAPIPPIKTQIELPSVDRLTGLDPDQMAQLQEQGFPSSLTHLTFAHLQGALALSGDCELNQTIEGEDEMIEALSVAVVSCTDDDRCSDLCPDNFYGMRFTAEVTLPIVDEETAAQIQEGTEDFELTGDAIKQIRFEVHKLDFYQKTAAGTVVSFNPWLADFQLRLGNAEGTQEVLVIDQPYLDDIAKNAEDCPEEEWEKPGGCDAPRFDVESTSQFTKELKDAILAGNTVSIRVILSLAIAQEDLYEVGFDGAGLEITIQPELVLSVIEVVKETAL